MADFGMGIASGALIEVLKLINNYRKEVKINKEQARLLASEAEQIINHLESLVTQVQKDGLSSNDPAYVALKRFSDEFHMSLLKIADRMKDWAALHWFTRALPGTKSEMQNEISELKSQLTRHWTVFQDQLATYNIYLTAQVKIRMEKIDTSLKDAREEDTKNDAIFIRQLAQTLKLSQENAEIGRETAVNIDMIRQMSISTAEAVNKLQTPATPASNEDPSMAEARMELIEALRSYEGEFPPFGIDSSELTMPFAGVPHYIGTNSIIHKGYRNGRLVAIKQLRIADPKELDTVYGRIRHEAEIWSGLIHPNITRFLGCCRPKDELGYMVSVWAEHEDARKYLKKHQDANFLKLVSTISHAALDMANGLKYLHEHKPHPIIHANLRGAHVLIDSNGIAQLNAFGISFVANEAYPGSRPPIVYWSSLEQLDDKTPQAASDIFSFALTFIELLTLTDPYKEHKIRNPIQLQKRILAGLRPKFPGSKYIAKGLPSSDCSLWLLLQRCWSAAPEDRPDINEVIEVLIESQDKRMD